MIANTIITITITIIITGGGRSHFCILFNIYFYFILLWKEHVT